MYICQWNYFVVDECYGDDNIESDYIHNNFYIYICQWNSLVVHECHGDDNIESDHIHNIRIYVGETIPLYMNATVNTNKKNYQQ